MPRAATGRRVDDTPNACSTQTRRNAAERLDYRRSAKTRIVPLSLSVGNRPTAAVKMKIGLKTSVTCRRKRHVTQENF